MPCSNADIARTAFHAVHSCNLADVAGLLDPVHILDQADSLPWGGHYVGIDGFRTFVSRLHAHVELAPEVEALIENGSEVIVCGRTRGRAKSTGLSFDVPFVNVYEFDEGQIVRSQAMVDEGGMLAALPGGARARAGIDCRSDRRRALQGGAPGSPGVQTLLVSPPST